MPSYYVLHLHYKGKNGEELKSKEPEFVIVDDSSMAEFLKLKEDLRKCAPEPFLVQYYDDEDDVVSIDTEDEFKEFTKVARKRSAKGMLIKLVLNINPPVNQDKDSYKQLPQRPKVASEKDRLNPVMFPQHGFPMNVPGRPHRGNISPGVLADYELMKQMVDEIPEDDIFWSDYRRMEADETSSLGVAGATSDYCMKQIFTKRSLMLQEDIDKLEMKIKNSLRKELMNEMKDHLAEQNKQNAPKEEMEYDEDSDGNLMYMPEKKRVKQGHNQKKLEKKEKAAESKFDQRLEKLELKKKKLLEKASLRTVVNRKPVDPTIVMPSIMSAIATQESSALTKKVTVGKVFLHMWHIINDGTVPWSNVELRHTWSTPGLEPDESCVKCVPLLPGQEGQVAMKFKAPKTVTSFISYWHFFYQFDSQWQQFSHYVSVTGSTKLPKTSLPHTVTKAQDTVKKEKEKEETKVKAEDNEKTPIVPKEEKIMNKETKSLYKLQVEAGKKRLEASLASAEIAAEMAREAANAAFRRAIGITPATAAHSASSEMTKLNRCFDEVVESVQSLSLRQAEETSEIPDLEDSASEKQANMDVNEESDPDFVIVNIPTNPELPNVQVKNIKVSLCVDSAQVHEMNTNLILVQENENNAADSEPTPVEEKKDEINGNEQVENIPAPTEQNEKIEPATLCEPLVPQSLSKPNVNINNSTMPLSDEYAYNKLDEQPHQPNMALPSPKLTLNSYAYSHVPQRDTMMPPGHSVSHQHNPHPGFPVFTPQNSSSHALVFPPPLIDFSNPKINPSMHYSQIPAYPPIQSTPHPMQLLSSGIASATAMPPQPAMQMAPPHMNPQPMVSHHFPMNRMIPMPVQRFDHLIERPALVKNIPMPAPKTTVTVTNNSDTEHNTPFVPLSVTVSEAKETSAPFSERATAAEGVKPAVLFVKNKKPESGVQILPQALVDGAINVASSAYSTAWNALNNLRPKEGEATEFDPVFENNMAALVEMGFTNMERNTRLLKQYHNDINQVIAIICANGGNDNLNID